MALELGELSTVLSADDKPLEQGLKRGHDRMRDAQRQYERTAEKGGRDAGKAGGDSFAAKLGTLAKAGALAAGAAAGLALGHALMSAMDLEAANDKLTAQLGLTAEQAKVAGQVAGSLYARAYGESVGEVSTAVGAVMSSFEGFRDVDAAGLEALTAQALNLSTAFEIDVARAAQVAGQAVKSGLAGDVYHAMDLITVSLQKVPAAVREDILDAVDEYGPFLTSIGITGEKAFGLLVKGAEKGMYGIDKTGDALKEFTIRATDMSTASKAGFDLLGMSQEEMSRRLLKGGEAGAKAFDQIIDGLLRIKDPVQQSQAALALFGTPLEDLSVAEIPKFLESLKSAEGGLGDVRGAAEEFGDTLNDNAKTKLESFKRTALLKLTELGGGIIGWAQEIAADPDVQDFMGDVERVLNERVLPALKEFFGWAEENVLPTLREIKDDGIDKLREGWEYLSDKIEDNRDELEQVGQVAKSVAEWFIQDVLPVVYALYYHGFVKLAWGIGLVIDWIGFLVTAFRKGRDAVGWVGDKAGWLLGKLNDLRKKVSFSGMFDSLKSAFKSAINWVISKWNNLSFTLPKIGPFGGQTVSTPNIPMLARGGNILADGLAMVGEAGPELLHLPRGARVQPLQSGQAVQGMAQVIGVLRLIVSHPDGRVIKDELISAADLRGQSVSKYLGVT